MHARETIRDRINLIDELASNPRQHERHRELRAQDIHHQREPRSNMGQAREHRGSSYGTEAWRGRGRFGQGLLPRHVTGQQSQSQEKGRWESGGRGPQIEARTATEGIRREGETGKGGKKQVQARSQNLQPTTVIGWVGGEEDLSGEGGYRAGKEDASTTGI